MPETPDLHNVGAALVAAAAETPQTTGDIVREMFPYIWRASLSLSTRKISDWLKSEHNISISQATISRALRSAPHYWEQLAEKIEPSCRLISEFCSREATCYLFHEEEFYQIENDIRFLPELRPDEDDYPRIERLKDAVDFLHLHWFVHTPEVWDNCKRYIYTDDEEELQRRAEEEALEEHYQQKNS